MGWFTVNGVCTFTVKGSDLPLRLKVITVCGNKHKGGCRFAVKRGDYPLAVVCGGVCG